MSGDYRPSQAPRLLAIDTPLGPDVLVLQRLSVTEALSRPFAIEAQVLARRADLGASDLIGKTVTCTVKRPSCPERHFHGVVRSFARVGLSSRGLALYRLEAVPHLWNLGRTADCRIFQNMPVADIIRLLLQEGGVAPVEFAAEMPTAPRTYVVQYNESDLDFLQRLLSEVGFAYFFRHTRGRHTLVFTPADGRSPQVPGEPAVVREDGDDVPGTLVEWRETSDLGPTSVVAHDHDMLKHGHLLKASTGGGAAGGEWEVFRWPGGQAVQPDANPSRIGMETVESGLEAFTAAGSDPAVFAGGKLAVKLAPEAGAPRSCLVTEVRHDAFDETHLVDGGAVGYRNAMSLVPARTPWRDPAPRPRPTMPGLQSAIVTGPPGEEIHCDEHGRIRIRFLWDRKGRTDDRSSCWVRVAQPWAGSGRGFWALPRVGDEVLVAFVDGDPDRPVVIGSLHGLEAPPPFTLPANRTQTGLLTRSSKGGGATNANMLRFEDKKGEEEIALHAERDLTAKVERDGTEDIGRDRTERVGRDLTTTVQRDRSATVEQGDDSVLVSQGDVSVKAAAGAITIEAAKKITLKVGSTTLELDPTSIKIKTGMLDTKADMMVKIESGGLFEEKAAAVFTMTGALIKLN